MTLDPSVSYVVCCENGRRSSAAAYILSERGFDTRVLTGGIAATDLLLKKGARVRLSESRKVVEGADQLMARGVELELGGHEPAGFASADLIVVSPGVPLEMPAIAAARGALAERAG